MVYDGNPPKVKEEGRWLSWKLFAVFLAFLTILAIGLPGLS
jgi:hypothetical protein